MKDYTFSNEEYNAIDKLLDKSGLRDVIQITSYKELFDCFWDYDEDKRISIKDGLQIIYESNANEICFENQDISKEEYEIANKLFKKFRSRSVIKVTRCYFCGTDKVQTSKIKVIGKDCGKRKQKTLNMCSCCSAMGDDDWIAEQLGWDEVVSVE